SSGRVVPPRLRVAAGWGLHMSQRSLPPPPNRNRPLPISIALLSGRNPRIRGFGWGRVGVGGREVVAILWRLSRPPHPTPANKGEGRAPLREPELEERPPHRDPLERLSKDRASGERETTLRTPPQHPGWPLRAPP